MTVSLYQALLWISMPLALGSFILLLFVPAPYGRHHRSGWGPAISARLGWIVMEGPAPLIFLVCFLQGTGTLSETSYLFLILWQLHYLQRAFIYPFQIAQNRRPLPVSVIIMGAAFNAGNAYLNGSYLFSLSGGYPRHWLSQPALLIGVLIFGLGFAINRWADKQLRQLQISSNFAYVIPNAGLYRWISCPNYLGEIIEWIGWAIATWSLPGLIFALWTMANLMPRARTHHRWYCQTFADYPHERKALIPGIW
jgi:3-oxo-5-alpha-steroid 4-dehydrogenase 1